MDNGLDINNGTPLDLSIRKNCESFEKGKIFFFLCCKHHVTPSACQVLLKIQIVNNPHKKAILKILD